MAIKNQIKSNFLTNIINLLVNILLAIFYIPYLVSSLGIYAYGIIPLAFIVNQYIKVLASSLKIFSLGVGKEICSPRGNKYIDNVASAT